MPNYDDLEAKVINTGSCTVCGACILACPNSHIKFLEGKPKRPKKTLDCVSCTTCYEACYTLRPGVAEEIEGEVLGRLEKGGIGIHRCILAARTKDQNVAKACQDGGMVTAILLYALNHGLIDGALVVGRDGWMPVAATARTRDDILLASGTKYGVVPVLKELRAAIVDHGLSNICVVGSPCHIQAIRYLKHRSLPIASPVKLTIGVFCRENYYVHAISEKLNEKGLDSSQVDKFNVTADFNIYTGGKKLSFPITEVKSFVPRHCLTCQDYSSELADIAVGSDGSPEGWSTVVARTVQGEAIISAMEKEGLIETMPLENLDSIDELATRKREKGKQTRDIFKLKDEGLDNKAIATRLGITESRVSHRLEGI
jgi:coenzyme F420 hydrogenase subunit beta